MSAPAYTITRCTTSRRWILEFLERARQTSLMHAIVDIDVTQPLARIASHRRLTGERISFSAFLLRCVADTVERFPVFNSYLLGRGKMVRFHDVDIATIIDHEIDGKHIPTTYVLRAAQSKSIAMIQNELRTAAGSPTVLADSGLGMRLLGWLPGGMQRFLWRLMTRDPRIRKKLEGTILVSDITKFSNRRIVGRAVAPSGASFTIVFANISKQPWVVGKQVVPRDILHVTFAVDHRIMDGPDLVGLKHLFRLIETGFELPPVVPEKNGEDETGRAGHDA